MAAPKKTASNTLFQECTGNWRPSGRALTRSEKSNTLSRYVSNWWRDTLRFVLLLEKTSQVDAADGPDGSIETVPHLDFFSYLLSQFGGDVESFRLAVNQHGYLVLGMEVNAVGAMAGGAATGALAFDKRSGQHFTQRTETADEFAAQLQVRVAGRSHMTLIIVSETARVKPLLRFARMP